MLRREHPNRPLILVSKDNRMVGQSLYSHITLERGERSPLADLASELL